MRAWQRLEIFATNLTVLLTTLVLMLTFSALMNAPGLPTSGAEFQRMAGAPVFDFRFGGYDSAALHETLMHAGVKGRLVYQRFMLLDVFFPAIYALFWVGLLRRSVAGDAGLWRWAPLAPSITALVDYGENVFIAVAVSLFPDASDTVVQLASACTRVKLLCTLLLLATVTAVLLRRAALAYQARHRRRGGEFPS